MKEIPVTEIRNIRIGQTEDINAGTGCTVFISENGMKAGIDIRGGGPASREAALLDPLMAADTIHGIVLSGGSAFGLDAAGGVMKYLEERNIGYDVGITRVPLVVQSGIFDLTVGDHKVRPDKAMGYEAARIAMEEPNYREGNYGAGTGATAGKCMGMDRCTKTGIGSYAVRLDDLEVGAVVVVNSLGDVYDWKTGQCIAGLLNEDKTGFECSPQLIREGISIVRDRLVQNTTLGVVITNAQFGKPSLCKIAGMAHDGYARSIRPVHTSFDGDSIYAVSVGDIKADMDVVGTIAAEVMSEAIIRAVRSAVSAYGHPASGDII